MSEDVRQPPNQTIKTKGEEMRLSARAKSDRVGLLPNSYYIDIPKKGIKKYWSFVIHKLDIFIFENIKKGLRKSQRNSNDPR